ncbi:MAG: hypothetical protein SAJ37_00110 [Oscillatoria sp. PMC 1068.18]|nr:hypothetical protein [Oscillatoria sp. PMC 1076.18]MEC4987123.1 hypothetical protein [Oscillatoria sp. PMC 1068.18]
MVAFLPVRTKKHAQKQLSLATQSRNNHLITLSFVPSLTTLKPIFLINNSFDANDENLVSHLKFTSRKKKIAPDLFPKKSRQNYFDELC